MGLRFVVVLLATVPREGWSGCDNNECISYNAYVYRTLDGANPNGGGANKQEEWLPALDGWDLCRGDADCKTVALSYGWGCHRIVGSVPEECECLNSCGCTAFNGRKWHTRIMTDNRTSANITEYGTSHADRILIRQPPDPSSTGCSP